MKNKTLTTLCAAFGLAASFALAANAQEKALSFRPRSAAQFRLQHRLRHLLREKLKELSGGKMLGRSVSRWRNSARSRKSCKLVKSGDIDFAIVSSANTATISPQAGVMSLHFLFRGEDHMVKALGEPKVFEAIRDMIDQTAQGIHAIGLGTQACANMYSKKEIHKIEDIKGPQDPRAGHRHRGRDLRGLWRADRAHAVRQRLHLAADRRR